MPVKGAKIKKYHIECRSGQLMEKYTKCMLVDMSGKVPEHLEQKL